MSVPSTFLTKDVEITRQSYTGDKSTFSTIATQKGYLRPLTEIQASENGFQFGQGFSLLMNDDADIQQGDKVVIDGKTFEVTGVATHDRLSIAHKRALLKLDQT